MIKISEFGLPHQSLTFRHGRNSEPFSGFDYCRIEHECRTSECERITRPGRECGLAQCLTRFERIVEMLAPCLFESASAVVANIGYKKWCNCPQKILPQETADRGRQTARTSCLETVIEVRRAFIKGFGIEHFAYAAP